MPMQATPETEDGPRELHPLNFFRGKNDPALGVRDYRAVPVDVDEDEPEPQAPEPRVQPGHVTPAPDAENVPPAPPDKLPGDPQNAAGTEAGADPEQAERRAAAEAEKEARRNKTSKGQAGTTPPD